jgi:DNA polymerase III subunit epsilon
MPEIQDRDPIQVMHEIARQIEEGERQALASAPEVQEKPGDEKMTDHQYEQIQAGYRCSVCWKTRKTKPDAYAILGCPGLPVYQWQTAPANLMTRKQLRAEKLKPGGPVRGYLPGKDFALYELFDKGEAVAVRPVSEKQAAALAKGREHAGERKCPTCGLWTPVQLISRKGQCYSCIEREEIAAVIAMHQEDRDEAIKWARTRLSEDAVILDTETTGLYSAEVIQISVIDMQGQILLDSLVKPIKPIPADATAIHGITDAMVADAPAWPAVFPHLVDVLKDRTVITYNADFDYGVIADSCIYNKLLTDDLPDGWRCAMLIYACYIGEWSDYHKGWKWQRLPGGDHSALGDCQATLRLIREMAEAKLSTEGE